MKVLIVEDEDLSADLIAGMIQDRFPDITICGRASDVEGAIDSYFKLRPDLLILDIEIRGGTGFDVLNAIKNEPIKVIFCTGYDEYAIRAFKYNAIDYLLKPISTAEFDDAIESARKILDQEVALNSILKHPNYPDPKYLVIADRKGYHRIKLDAIVRATAEGAYTRFDLTTGNQIITSRSLGYYEEILPPTNFIRVHHSAIVQVACIVNSDPDLGQIELETGIIQEVSTRKRKLLKLHLGLR
ncbi:MAG: response regulator transcription factor [Bacteroidia bacterium]|nr:response regulator transcription factor [Bacteroidia bacterium]